MKTKSTCNGFALLVLSMLSWLTGDCCAQATAQQDTNYWHYHELIYKAECALFDQHDVNACLQYYDQAFNNFEFNYAHDLVNAAQLAHYYHRDYMKYLKRAVLFGVRPMHLKYIPAWTKAYVPVYKEFLTYFRSKEGQTIRQQYLATINQEYLAWTYQFVLREMKYRRSPHGNEYWDRFNQWDKDLLQKIKEYGFPGAKLIGVDDSLLYKEIQNDNLDFNRLVNLAMDSLCIKRYLFSSSGDTIWLEKECGTELSYEDLAQGKFMLYLIHHPCPQKIFETTYDEITKGNLHPRDYAFMLDHMRTGHGNQAYGPPCNKCEECAHQYFRIGHYFPKTFFGKFHMSDNETDVLRKQYWIIPLRVEQAKAQFGREHGYRFNWGFHSNYTFQ